MVIKKFIKDTRNKEYLEVNDYIIWRIITGCPVSMRQVQTKNLKKDTIK